MDSFCMQPKIIAAFPHLLFSIMSFTYFEEKLLLKVKSLSEVVHFID